MTLVEVAAGRPWAGRLTLIVVLAFTAILIWRDRHDVAASLGDIGGPSLGAAALLAVAGTVTISLTWVTLLRGIGVRAPTGEAVGIFVVTQLGKYVPGSVWPVLAQMRMGRRWGASKRAMLAANVLMLAFLMATGATLGVALLPWVVQVRWLSPWWAVLAVPLLAVALHPRTLSRVLHHGLSRFGRDPFEIDLHASCVARALGWAIMSWLLLGGHVWVLLRASGAGDVRALVVAVGGLSLGWALGILVVPVPAGAGVRDGILVAVCTPLVGVSGAVAVALASRVILLAADGALAVMGALVSNRLRPSATVAGDEH